MTAHRRRWIIAWALLAGLASIVAAQDPPPSIARPDAPARPARPVPKPNIDGINQVYGMVLTSIVSPEGLVRYDQLRQKMRRDFIEAVVDLYGKADLPENADARKAFWINAYNANVIWMALNEREKEGFTTVKDVPGFFEKHEITVAGETLTLDKLENEKLRPLGDPRIHAALVCAAKSCSPLRQHPYQPGTIDQDLNDQSRAWINDETKNFVKDGVLHLSSIFKWFEKDFEGKPYGGAVGFVKHFAAPESELAKFLEENPSPKVEYIEYDWSLNEAPKPAPKPAQEKPEGKAPDRETGG